VYNKITVHCSLKQLCQCAFIRCLQCA